MEKFNFYKNTMEHSTRKNEYTSPILLKLGGKNNESIGNNDKIRAGKGLL